MRRQLQQKWPRRVVIKGRRSNGPHECQADGFRPRRRGYEPLNRLDEPRVASPIHARSEGSKTERTFAQLRVWAADENAHVRRLVSEGTRLRLPWASRVAWLDANPRRVLALLELLKDDPTMLVRRSVANNLNDLSKVHADQSVETCRAWLRTTSPETRTLVRHALRSLVKKGHRGALDVLGVGASPHVELSAARLSAKAIRLGAEIRFSFSLQSTSSRAQELVVDYAMHFVKANGTSRPKVFKLRRITLEANESASFEGKVSFAPMTTRQHYPGRHRIEVLVNGVAFPLGELEVRS